MAQTALIKAISEIENAASEEAYIEALGVYEAARRTWRELDEAFKEARIEFHRRHGDVDLPDGRRFYLATTKRTKCKDTRETLEALLEATGGDLDSIAECLSANAFKHGACRKPLGEKWGDLFTVEEVMDVKTGTAKQVVKVADDRYLETS